MGFMETKGDRTIFRASEQKLNNHVQISIRRNKLDILGVSVLTAQSTEAVEYFDCISAEG